METLSDNNTLRFLNLEGNQVLRAKYLDQFLVAVKGFVMEDYRNLMHLNLNGIILEPMRLTGLMKVIQEDSKSLQSLHFSVSQDLQSEVVMLAQMIGIRQFEVESEGAFHSAKDNEQLSFLKQNTADHLIASSQSK